MDTTQHCTHVPDGEPPCAKCIGIEDPRIELDNQRRAIQDLIDRHGKSDRKQWLIDQILRVVTGDSYADFVEAAFGNDWQEDDTELTALRQQVETARAALEATATIGSDGKAYLVANGALMALPAAKERKVRDALKTLRAGEKGVEDE